MDVWSVQVVQRPAAPCTATVGPWRRPETAGECAATAREAPEATGLPLHHMQRPLSKWAEVTDNAQGPLVKVQRSAVKTRCTSWPIFSSDFTKISHLFPSTNRIRTIPYKYPLKPLHSTHIFCLIILEHKLRGFFVVQGVGDEFKWRSRLRGFYLWVLLL